MMRARIFLLSMAVVLTCAPWVWAQRVTVVPGGKGPGGRWDPTSIWIIVVALSPVLLFLGIRLAKAVSERRSRHRL